MKNKKRYLVLLLLLFVMVGTKVLFTSKPDNNYTKEVDFDGGKLAITFSDAEEMNGSQLWYKWNNKNINLTFGIVFDGVAAEILEASKVYVTINGVEMEVEATTTMLNETESEVMMGVQTRFALDGHDLGQPLNNTGKHWSLFSTGGAAGARHAAHSKSLQTKHKSR